MVANNTPTPLPGITRRAFVRTSALAAAAGALPGMTALAAEAPADELVIFHTNDVHGYLEPAEDSAVGINYVAGLRSATPNSLLLDAGDVTQGAPLASLSKGATPFELMAAAGYDAMCLGNHEFDFGTDVLIANVQAAPFPVLGANALLNGAPLLAGVQGADADGCSAILTCGGRRIGVFGLTTVATAWSVNPEGLGQVTFADEVETAEAQVSGLVERGAEAVVCLAHLGDGDVPCTGPQLAQNLSPEAASHVVAIIDGHSHTVENALVNGILVVQTGCNLANVGRLTLTFGADGSVSAAEELLDPASVQTQAQASPQVTAELDEAVAEQDELLSERVCVNPATLWAGWVGSGDIAAPTRMVETNLGDFICECYINAASEYLGQAGLDDGSPVVAVENGGGIRAALPRGVLTLRELVTTFPFSNTVQVKRVTPRLLRQQLEVALSSMNGQDLDTGMLLQQAVSGGFLQVGGFEVTVDANAPVGARVRELYVHGLADVANLDDDETQLFLVSNSYVLAGGGGREELGQAPLVADLGGQLEVLRAYIDELACALPVDEVGLGSLPLVAGTKGRLIFEGERAPETWEACLRLVDAHGQALPGAEAVVEVDSGTLARVTSDAEGLVRVEVPAGGHGMAAYEPGLLETLSADGAARPDAGAASSGEAESASSDGAGLARPTSSREAWAAAVARTLLVPAAEAFVDNHMGMGLVEDDLRAFPTLVLTTAAEG